MNHLDLQSKIAILESEIDGLKTESALWKLKYQALKQVAMDWDGQYFEWKIETLVEAHLKGINYDRVYDNEHILDKMELGEDVPGPEAAR